MENSGIEKKVKPSKTQTTATVRIKKDTKKRLSADLAKANKKTFGKRVRIDEYLNMLLGLVMPEHIQKLQDASLSNADRLERDYRAYVAEHGMLSKDSYLGIRMNHQTQLSSSTDSKESES